MASYRCYFIGRIGEIRLVEDIESETAVEAIRIGRQKLADRPHYPALEVWQRGRWIHTETRGE